jgi:hypothetical protein
MPTPTYTAIAKTVLTSSQTSIVFSGISQSYTDLILLLTGRSTTGTTGSYYWQMKPNNATNQVSGRYIEGYGAGSVGSGYTQNDAYMNQIYGVVVNGNTSNTFGSAEVYIPNYSSTSNYKVFSGIGVSESNNATANWAIDAVASLYRDNSAISSLTITTSGNFATGSSFYLYGISSS